jgi:hypothetical protein
MGLRRDRGKPALLSHTPKRKQTYPCPNPALGLKFRLARGPRGIPLRTVVLQTGSGPGIWLSAGDCAEGPWWVKDPLDLRGKILQERFDAAIYSEIGTTSMR